MNCPNCGTQNIDGAKFCIKCGVAILSSNQQIPKLHAMAS